MNTEIIKLIDAAKKVIGTKSDRELSRRLNLADTTVHFYRSGKANPSDTVFADMAELANQDPLVAVCKLHECTAKDNTASLWHEIAKRVASAAAVIMLIVSLHGPPTMAGGDASPA
jgi:hypothetical protein